MTLIHQRQYNVQPSALGKCNSTIILGLGFVETEPTRSRTRNASRSLSSMDLYNFRINIKDFLHSHSSCIFNKHSATVFL